MLRGMKGWVTGRGGMMSAQVVGELLRERARETPDRLFLWCGDDRMTYAEADARSDRVAAGLSELGVTKGDRVAFISMNRPEMLEMLFGCAKLGAIQVPLNAFLKGEFLRYQLDDCQASTLVCDAAGYAAAAELLDRLPELRRIVVFDEVQGPRTSPLDVVPYEQVRSSTAPVPRVELAPGDLMSIVYTSGTTGLPKGCMLSHGYYLHVGAACGQMWECREGDLLYTALPLFHGAARMMVVMTALVYCLTAVVDPVFSVTTILRRLAETGATVFGGVAAMGVAMLSLPPSEADRAHRLRLAAFVPFPPALQEQFERRFGVPTLGELYGQTECVPVTYSQPSGPRRRSSAGIPAPYLDVRLVDDEDNEVPVGQVGEIVIRPRKPYAMFQGYWRKPEETRQAWRNLWHHTGDYGRFDEQGFLHFVDRKKDAIRRRGENISSLELEAAISAHPKIQEAAVHAVPSEMLEDEVKACIVLAPGEVTTPEELFAFFKEKLPYFAVPRYVEILPELPKNAVGRVMKHLLRERGVTETTWDLQAMGLTVPREERR